MEKQREIKLFENKYECCGCNACEVACVKEAISMLEDEFGFRYPMINHDKCIKCGKCLKVCCIRNKTLLKSAKEVYAVSYLDKAISAKSASGGVFAALANYIINEKGVVYGSAYTDDFTVEVISIKQQEDIEKLQGSKYVQSAMNECYKEIRNDLQTGKKVLFCGVPCQVAALKRFLEIEYKNLLLTDIVCHGVPSNRLFKDYISFVDKSQNITITHISFRTKEKGQDVNGKIIYRQSSHTGKIIYRQKPLISYKSSYYKLFLNCQTFRDSCYQCKFAQSERVGDLSFCDYWGIEDEHPDFLQKVAKEGLAGISAVMLNTETGIDIVSRIKKQFIYQVSTMEKLAKHNPQLNAPSIISRERQEILDLYKKGGYAAIDAFYYKKYKFKILLSELGKYLPNSWKKKILQIIRGRR